MMLADTEEYTRLCQKIEAAQEEAEWHYRQRQCLADCVALLILQAVGEREPLAREAAGRCGTQQAALQTWLRGAFGWEYRPHPLLLECAADIVAALGRVSRKEGEEEE